MNPPHPPIERHRRVLTSELQAAAARRDFAKAGEIEAKLGFVRMLEIGRRNPLAAPTAGNVTHFCR